ncbi:MAG: SH3 domain-containing protein, partial [Acidobacteriales bacterium]|nr:SH3 domain-containing protein [Terriglobales bacterium]
MPNTSRNQILLFCFLIAITFLSACNRGRGKVKEIAYVSASQAILRDHVSTVYVKTATVKNGDRVEILEHDRRFVRIRTANATEGWLEQRNLVPEQVFAGFQNLSQQEQNSPVQGSGTTRNETNLHLSPGRDTEHLYLLNDGTKVEILKRAMAEKTGAKLAAKIVPQKSRKDSAAKVEAPAATAAPILE